MGDTLGERVLASQIGEGRVAYFQTGDTSRYEYVSAQIGHIPIHQHVSHTRVYRDMTRSQIGKGVC
jgi:hypothetical protein